MDRKFFEIFGPSGWENELKIYLKEKYNFIETDYGLVKNKSEIIFAAGIDEPLFSVVGETQKGYKIKPEATGIFENREGNKGYAENGLLFFPQKLERTTPLRKAFWISETEKQIAGSNAGYRILPLILAESDYPVILLYQTLLNIPYTFIPLIESGIKLIFYLIPFQSEKIGENPYVVFKTNNYILPENFRNMEIPKKIIDVSILPLQYNNYMEATIIPIIVPFLFNRESIVMKENIEQLKFLLRRLYEKKN